jgi:hypothetical protein
MSTPAPVPPKPKYSGGQIALIVIGIILLLPGLCSLLFALGMAPEMGKSVFRDPIAQAIITLWAICFAVSALGIVLIAVARKRARRAS